MLEKQDGERKQELHDGSARSDSEACSRGNRDKYTHMALEETMREAVDMHADVIGQTTY